MVLPACLLAVLAASVPVRPLQLEPAPAATVESLAAGDFAARQPGEPLGPWSGGQLKPLADGRAAMVVDAPAGEGQLRYAQTLRLDQGHPYQLRVDYRTALKGAYVQLNHYAFYTWGDTLRVDRVPLPPSPDGFGTVTVPYTPIPGEISVGLWLSAPGPGTIEVTRFSLSGPPWGGVAYPAAGPEPGWTVIDRVRNSVPVDTLYYGPGAQNTFPITRGRGQGVPWVPLGAVVPPVKGGYAVGIEVREPGGGPLLARYAGRVDAPEDALPAARILLPAATRTCDVQLVAHGPGGLRGPVSLALRYDRTEPLTAVPTWQGVPAAREPWPGGGQVALSLPGEAVRDFVPDAPVTGQVTIARGAQHARLRLRVQRYDRLSVLDTTTDVPAGLGEAVVPVRFTPPGPDLYEVQAQLLTGDLIADERTVELGLRDPHADRPFVKPDLPAMFMVEEMAFASLHDAPAAHEQYTAFCADIKANGSNTAGIGYALSDFNPAPGLYRFAELDQRIELARRAGLHSYVYLRLNPQQWPDWAGWEAPLDQDGRPDEIVSVASPAVRRVVADAMAALARHYRGDRDVVGFGRWNPGTDWLYHDTAKRHFDYGPSALARWRAWSGGLPAPKPLAQGPDLRPEWRRWAAFRTELARLWQIEALGEPVRREDPERWIVGYHYAGGFGEMETLWPEFRRLRMYPAHGGSDPSDFRRFGELAHRAGVFIRHESVAAPERHPQQTDLYLFHSLFNGLPPGWTPAYNVAWNIGWNHTHGQPGVVAARARRQQVLAVVAEMARGGFDRAPSGWAQLASWDDLLLGGARDFQWHTLASDLELGDMRERLSHDTVSDRTPAAKLGRYRLLFADRDRVLTAETARTLRGYIEAGGTAALVLYPGVGQAQAARELLGLTLPAEAPAGKVTATGRVPWFSAGRKLVLESALDLTLPDATPIAARADGRPVAWARRLGQGTLLVFAGPPDLAASEGFLEDILNHVGVRRRFDLTSAQADDPYPPEAIEFVDRGGTVMLWVHRAVRWNRDGDLRAQAQAKGCAPTLDGFAQAFARVKVAVAYLPERPGRYRAERWRDGRWEPLGKVEGAKLAGPELALELAPGELGVIRLTHLPEAGRVARHER